MERDFNLFTRRNLALILFIVFVVTSLVYLNRTASDLPQLFSSVQVNTNDIEYSKLGLKLISRDLVHLKDFLNAQFDEMSKSLKHVRTESINLKFEDLMTNARLGSNERIR